LTKSADLPPPPDEYFLEIEAHFAARRGTPFLFSAKDWALIGEWKEEGVPLAIVLEAIDSCFEKREKSGRKRSVSSLSYCRHAVREIWDERRDLHVGAEQPIPELSPQKRLVELALEVDAVVDADEGVMGRVRRAATEIRKLDGKTVPQIEESLITIEEELLEDLHQLLPGGRKEVVERKLAESIEGVRFRDDETAERTRRANLRRILRTELGLPRLTLL
jgi:hypothetical protein